jgi:hypothetical protein
MNPSPRIGEQGQFTWELVVQRESYVQGNGGPPLLGKTIGALQDDVSATDGIRNLDFPDFGVPDVRYGEELRAWIIAKAASLSMRRASVGSIATGFPATRFRATSGSWKVFRPL